MSARKETLYRVGGAIVLLVAGALIVVWAARSHLSRYPWHGAATRTHGLAPDAGHEGSPRGSLTRQERTFLLDLARRTVEEVVKNNRMPQIDESGLSSRLMEPKGCFVTLKKNGQLRGCIGHILPQEPLYRAVMDNARSAATRDTRFPRPVQPEELEEIEIEVSVLTVPQRLEFDTPDDLLNKLRPRVDGVVLRIGRRQSTYLPQVWEDLPEKETFLGHLSAKAGLPPGAWQTPETAVWTYQAEAFKESEM